MAEYVVTLFRKEDLEQFYLDMTSAGYNCLLKRPLSRNTHYDLTPEQVIDIQADSRVWGVELAEEIKIARQMYTPNQPYQINGTFWKDDTIAPSTISVNDYQWAHLHCSGTSGDRQKGNWGSTDAVETVTAGPFEIYNAGKNVDVVIVDDTMAFDCEEWYSPTTNVNRFVQYQWFTIHNSEVGSIDDDGQTLPTGSITYYENVNLPVFHGNHVGGTIAGKYYGWANEANIYNLSVLSPYVTGQQVGALLIFDYLRAFHLNKEINLETGYRNPTITNHSYGGIWLKTNETSIVFGDITQFVYQGVTYTPGSPPSGGWTQSVLERDFGLRFNIGAYPSYSTSIIADVQDAINDGVVIIGAAGNDNLYMAESTLDPNWNNTVTITDLGTIYYMRGAWPNSVDSGAITVGSLSNRADFRRSSFSNFGPAIDIFAPGDNIISAWPNPAAITGSLNGQGLVDTKPSNRGSGNWFYPINGTSMASPQVAGIIASAASGKKRFSQEDAYSLIHNTSERNDMSFDIAGGLYDDATSQHNSPNEYVLSHNPRKSQGYISGWNGNTLKGKRKSKDVSRGLIAQAQLFPRQNTLVDIDPEYTLTTNGVTTTNEGSSVTFVLQTKNVSPDTQIPFTITGVSSADIDGASLTGIFTALSGTSQIFNITNDNLLEGLETMTVTLDGLGVSAAIGINDTSYPNWNPSTDITAAIWFDASDTSSYTTSSNNVQSVTDKAGNATVTVNGTPHILNTLDGKNVWTFAAGSNEDFTTNEVAQASSGNHWAIGVMQWNSINDTQDSFWSIECNTQTPKRDYAISAGNASAFNGELDLDGLSSNRISSTIGNLQNFDSGIAQNTWLIICAIFNKTGNQIAVRVNGLDKFTPVNDYDNSINTNQDLRIFRNRANERMDGRMAEFFSVADTPGTGGTDITDVEKAEGYLAHKWGLTSSLPSGHPYKNTQP